MQRQSKSGHPWWLDIGFRAFVVYVWYSLLTLVGINVKNRHIAIRMKGFNHPFYARFGSSDIGVFNQIFSEQEYSCLSDVVDPKLIIDCGSNDFFYKVNCNLHEKLLLNNIPHDFISRPGEHNWDYWANSIKYQLLFMNNFFADAGKKK